MKHKLVIEGVMKFTFSYSIEAENSMEAFDEGIRRVAAMNNNQNPASGFGKFEETPRIIYHVKEVNEDSE